MTGCQIPIHVGNGIIKPGDIFFADIDGVSVISQKIAVGVWLRAEVIEKNEGEIKQWVAAGLSTEKNPRAWRLFPSPWLLPQVIETQRFKTEKSFLLFSVSL